MSAPSTKTTNDDRSQPKADMACAAAAPEASEVRAGTGLLLRVQDGLGADKEADIQVVVNSGIKLRHRMTEPTTKSDKIT